MLMCHGGLIGIELISNKNHNILNGKTQLKMKLENYMLTGKGSRRSASTDIHILGFGKKGPHVKITWRIRLVNWIIPTLNMTPCCLQLDEPELVPSRNKMLMRTEKRVSRARSDLCKSRVCGAHQELDKTKGTLKSFQQR